MQIYKICNILEGKKTIKQKGLKMGADLFIEPIFSQNYKKYERNFIRACKERDLLIKDNQIFEVEKFVREKLNIPRDEVSPMIPKNMKIPYEEKMRKKYNAFIKAQAKVDKWYNKMYEVGYFRDSYNITSLLWRLDMSWWACPYIKNGKITPEDAKVFLKEIELRKIRPVTPEELKEEGYDDENIDESVESLNKYFIEKKKRFIAFLKNAINRNLEITASV